MLVLAAALLAALLILAALARRPRRPPYVLCDSLLTPGEMAFNRVLDRCLPPGCRVMMKVRLADVITVPRGSDESQSWWAKIKQKHCDFVLVDTDSLQPILVIELNDKSHDRADRKARDAFLEQAFDVAGLPLLWVKAAAAYDTRQVRLSIFQKLGLAKQA